MKEQANLLKQKESLKKSNLGQPRIIVDTREDSAVEKAFKRLGYTPKVKALPIGDILIEDDTKSVIIERKTIGDFVGSVYSGHLEKQLLQQDQLPNSYLILIGSQKDLFFNNPTHCKWTVDQHLGMLASIAIRRKTKLLAVSNNSQFAKLCLKLFTKTNDGRISDIYSTELLKDKLTTEDIKLRMIACVPGISIKLAQRLKDKLKISVSCTDGQTIEEGLKKVEGIGGKKRKATQQQER